MFWGDLLKWKFFTMLLVLAVTANVGGGWCWSGGVGLRLAGVKASEFSADGVCGDLC